MTLIWTAMLLAIPFLIEFKIPPLI